MTESQAAQIIEYLSVLVDRTTLISITIWIMAGCIGGVGLLVAWHGGRK